MNRTVHGNIVNLWCKPAGHRTYYNRHVHKTSEHPEIERNISKLQTFRGHCLQFGSEFSDLWLYGLGLTSQDCLDISGALERGRTRKASFSLAGQRQAWWHLWRRTELTRKWSELKEERQQAAATSCSGKSATAQGRSKVQCVAGCCRCRAGRGEVGPWYGLGRKLRLVNTPAKCQTGHLLGCSGGSVLVIHGFKWTGRNGTNLSHSHR
jgi:hypothetical protein